MGKKPRTVRVRCADGLVMPGRELGHRVITADASVEVPYNAFVRRRIKRGDLLVVADKQPAKRTTAAPKTEAKE